MINTTTNNNKEWWPTVAPQLPMHATQNLQCSKHQPCNFQLYCMVPENIHTPPRRVFFQFDPHPTGFSVPEGFVLLPHPPGISMIFPLGPPYPLEIPNPKKRDLINSFWSS